MSNPTSKKEMARALWSEAGIRVHQGKTQIWNSAGEMPDGCEALQTAAELSDVRV